jgi:hypothetical protein
MGDGSVATVRIVDTDVAGGRLINEADFDPKSHTKFEEKAASDSGSKPKTLDDLTKDELVAEAKRLGLETGGMKKELYDRIFASGPASNQ